jgi:branched-chain amino acid transport system substrate-binding protein
LSRFDHDKCENHSQCRDSFGFGATCNADGFCEAAKVTNRCSTTPFPEDLFTRPQQYKNAIVIGSLMDHSAPAHLIREKAVRLAVKEMDSAGGGLDGRLAAVVFCDIAKNTNYDALERPAAAVESAKFLAGTLGVSAIVGPSASGDTQQVWEAIRTTGTVVISPAATSPALATLEPAATDEAPGFLWRVAPPDSLQGSVIAADMLERMVTEVVIIRETGAYGEGLAQVFQEAFTKGGGKATIVSISADTQLGEAAAMAATSTASDILFISSQQDWIIKFLNAASGQAGYMTKQLFLTDAAANAAVLTGAAGAAALFPNVHGTRPAPRSMDDFVYASFFGNYKAEYSPEDPSAATFSAHSYDATWLVLYGAAWSILREGKLTGLGTARGLRKVSSGAATQILTSSWPTVIAKFRAGESVNLSGASGEIDFDPTTKSVTAPIEVWKIATDTGTPAITRVTVKTPGG